MTHGAELAGKNENAPLKQHAGIELEQVPHIDGHNQLGQVPLQETKHAAHAHHEIATDLFQKRDTPDLKGIRYEP